MSLLPMGSEIDFYGRDRAEKIRLDAIRLECLKLANSAENATAAVRASEASPLIDTARMMFEFVTDAPKAPEPLKLFVVRRTMEITGCEPEKSHLSISGNWPHWSYPQFAFRFVSETEAHRAVGKHASTLYGDDFLPSYDVEQLPDSTELF